MAQEIELGAMVREGVTGFEGVVVTIANYHTGQTRVEVRAKDLQNGKSVSEWFDTREVGTIIPGGKPAMNEW